MKKFEAYMEEQILLLLDKELSPAQEAELWVQIKAYPEFQALYDAYSELKLSDDFPELDFSYLQKNEIALLNPPRAKSKIIIWPFAAALVLIMGIGLVLKFNHQTHEISDAVSKELAIVDSDKQQSKVPQTIKKSGMATSQVKAAPKAMPERLLAKAKPIKKHEQIAAVFSKSSPQREPLKTLFVADEDALGQGIVHLGASFSPKKKIDKNRTAELISAPVAVMPEIEEQSVATKGLLPEMIKAGQWIMGAKANKPSIVLGKSGNQIITVKF